MQYYCHISLLLALWYSQAKVSSVVWLALFIMHISILFVVYFINGHHKLSRSPFFCNIAPHHWVIGASCFETALKSHLQGSNCQIKNGHLTQTRPPCCLKMWHQIPSDMAPYHRWWEASIVLLHMTEKSYIHGCVITRGRSPFTMYIKVVLHFLSITWIKWKCQMLIWKYVMLNFPYKMLLYNCLPEHLK